MELRHVPVYMGCRAWTEVEVDAFRLTEAWFPPHVTLPPHTHDRACFAVMLEGSFDVTFPGRSFACPPSSVHTEPVGDRHSNLLNTAGAHVLVVQPDPEATELLRPCQALLGAVTHQRHEGIAGQAWQVVHELATPDTASPLMVEGLVLQMLASAARICDTSASSGRPPPWLERAREIVHARFRERLEARAIAHDVGVHPVHLARSFRAHYHMPIGAYLRRLRVEWAAHQVAATDRALSGIAIEAGFADQSHFTRTFKRQLGATPGQFRKRHQGSPSGVEQAMRTLQNRSARRLDPRDE